MELRCRDGVGEDSTRELAINTGTDKKMLFISQYLHLYGLKEEVSGDIYLIWVSEHSSTVFAFPYQL